MSNLLKRSAVVSNDERVIDYNEIIRNKLESILSAGGQNANPDNFVSGLDVDVVRELISDPDSEDAVTAEETALSRIEQKRQELEQMQSAADGLVEEAKRQAESIIADAKTRSTAMMNMAREQGYAEGLKKAEDEILNIKAKSEQDKKDYKALVDSEYQQYREQLEPELVNALADVFGQVFTTIAEDDYEILMHLINGVLKDYEKSGEFIIKASPRDCDFLRNNQGKLHCAMNKEVILDIVEDTSLEHNQCLIETDGGVFNCSLDIELGNLVKKIKLLSCM